MSDYEVLGLTPNATGEEIKKRYKELCKIYHPDNNPNGDDEMLKKINEAYHNVIKIIDNQHSNVVVNERQPGIDYEGLLNEYIVFAYGKYENSISTVVGYLKTYLEGVLRGITSDHGYRDLFKQHMTPSIASEIIGDDVLAYVTNIVMSYTKDDAMIMEAFKATYKKLGYEQLYLAIDYAIEHRDDENPYKAFTNDGRGLRDYLKANIDAYTFVNYTTRLLDADYRLINQTIGQKVADVIRNIVVNESNQKTR